MMVDIRYFFCEQGQTDTKDQSFVRLVNWVKGLRSRMSCPHCYTKFRPWHNRAHRSSH